MERINDIMGWLQQISPDINGVCLDGQIHRFGPNKVCWYVAREVQEFNKPSVIFAYGGNWKEGFEGAAYLCEKKLTQKVLRQAEKDMQAIVGQQTKSLQEKAKEEAKKIQASLSPLGPITYLARKKIESYKDPNVGFNGDILHVPCVDLEDQIWGYQRIAENGSKYFQSGQKVTGTFYPIGDDTDTILVCEGYATGVSLHLATQLKTYVCFSLGNLEAITKLLKESYIKKTIVICGDDDYLTNGNPGMTKATYVAKSLKIPVIFPKFQKRTCEKWTDFNDLHCIEGLEAVKAQVDACLNNLKKNNTTNAVTYRETEKVHCNDISQNILEAKRIITDKNKNTFTYNGQYWESLTQLELERLAQEYDSFYTTCQHRRREVVSMVRSTSLYPSEIPWRSLGLDQIPFKNGVYSIDTNKLEPHKAEQYLETVLPYDYNPNAKFDRWMECLNEWFKDDPLAYQKKYNLQCFFGYLLMPHAHYKKALLCYGPSNSGKSIIGKVMKEIVGLHQTCSLSVEDMGDPRKRAPIRAKMLNLITELNHNALIHDAGFKQLISTEEPVTIEQKFKDPETYVPFCKHVILTNTLPAINDQSEGTFNRLLLIEFTRVIEEAEQDDTLFEQLKEEISGIINWALIGAEILFTSGGKFETIESSQNLLRDHIAGQNPVHLFKEEKLISIDDREQFITNDAFQEAFKNWYGKWMSPVTLGRLAKQAGINIIVMKRFQKAVKILDGWRLEA